MAELPIGVAELFGENAVKRLVIRWNGRSPESIAESLGEFVEAGLLAQPVKLIPITADDQFLLVHSHLHSRQFLWRHMQAACPKERKRRLAHHGRRDMRIHGR